jgi:hypothetical protein
MTDATLARREKARAFAALGARILSAAALGASLDKIASEENLKPRDVERLLRAQLAKGFTPSVEEFARLQIVRLEAVIARLGGDPSPAHVAASSVMLKAFERLDRYYGFGGGAAPEEPTETVKRQIIDKLNRMAARSLVQSAPPQSARQAARDASPRGRRSASPIFWRYRSRGARNCCSASRRAAPPDQDHQAPHRGQGCNRHTRLDVRQQDSSRASLSRKDHCALRRAPDRPAGIVRRTGRGNARRVMDARAYREKPDRRRLGAARICRDRRWRRPARDIGAARR